MIPAKAIGPDYGARVRRAETLAARFSFAKELLEFYQRIARSQGELCAAISKDWNGRGAPHAQPLRASLNVTPLIPHFPKFLSLVAQAAPQPLAEAAQGLASQGPAAWPAVLNEYWEQGGRGTKQAEPKTRFLSHAFLQPCAELAAQRAAIPPVLTTPRICPLCESWPVLGVLRPEGDGGKRFLVCSFCGHEWEFRRILCPACGEEEEKKLPVYVAGEFPYIRVEACETCQFSLRTIDLTKDGNAVPIVDDIAAIPLSLWAEEHGYKRLQPNLLGS